MTEIDEILRPSWGLEKWIAQGWDRLEDNEKNKIRSTIDALELSQFKLDLKCNKTIYLYTFSLMAQFEVLALQSLIALIENPNAASTQNLLKKPLFDSVLRCLFWSKLVYIHSAPYAMPPSLSGEIETLCQLMREEQSPLVATVFYKLIAFGWVTEIQHALQAKAVALPILDCLSLLKAPNDFSDIQAKLECVEPSLVSKKLEQIEERMLMALFSQFKYIVSLSELLGADGAIMLMQSIHNKHSHQLAEFKLRPTDRWLFFMSLAEKFAPKMASYCQSNEMCGESPLRKMFMTAWDNPFDPTMICSFNLDISGIDFFNKKFPSETVTILLMQSVSKFLSSSVDHRTYLSHGKFYQTKESYIALVVKLPGCGDHLANVVFENCHEMSFQSMTVRLHSVIRMMTYCFKKREWLEQQYPHLKQYMDSFYDECKNDVYRFPMPGNGAVSISNVGQYGFASAISPLFPNEAMKFTLSEVDKRLVWNKDTQTFEQQDILPVTISADHRVFDGNVSVPKLIRTYFNAMFTKMQEEGVCSKTQPEAFNDASIMAVLDHFVASNLEFAYKMLVILQTYWMDYLQFDAFLASQGMAMALENIDVV